MFKRLIEKYDYDHIMHNHMPKATLVATTAGTAIGAWAFTLPNSGPVRLRDAFFGGIIGGIGGMGLGALGMALHPLLIVSPVVLGPYAYHKYKELHPPQKKDVPLEWLPDSNKEVN